MMKPTPRPWTFQKTSIFAGKRSEQLIALCRTPFAIPEAEFEANAAHIVKCVNLHDDLVEQLRQAWACIEHIKGHAPDYEKKASVEMLKDIGKLISKALEGEDNEHT